MSVHQRNLVPSSRLKVCGTKKISWWKIRQAISVHPLISPVIVSLRKDCHAKRKRNQESIRRPRLYLSWTSCTGGRPLLGMAVPSFRTAMKLTEVVSWSRFLGTVDLMSVPVGPQAMSWRKKIPWEGEFTLRSDPWAGLIASCGSF